MTHIHKSFTLIQMTTQFSSNHVYPVTVAVCGRRCPWSTATYQWRCVLWLRWSVCCLWVALSYLLVVPLWLRFWLLQVGQHLYRQILFPNHMFLISWNFRTGLGRFWSGIWNIEPQTPEVSNQEFPPSYGEYNIYIYIYIFIYNIYIYIMYTCMQYTVYIIWIS